ncbi:MAG: hypothetical protein IPO21_08775 [Bacteroidales bacterium]|nr:hypothetical protein [Bacteroidales bacterium]
MIKRFVFATLVLILTQHVFGQTNEAYQWKNVSMGGGGFVSAIITSAKQKDLMYARTDVGGAYRWDAVKKSWIPLTDWVSQDEVGLLGIEALAIDPQAPNKLYMLAGISYFNGGKTQILRSDDYGATFKSTDVTSQFKAHGNGMGRQTGERLVVDPNNSNILFCGTRRNGLFKSTDGGVSWSAVSSLAVSSTPNDNGICIVAFDPQSTVSNNATQTIYVGVSILGTTNLYVSKDAGASWAAVASQPTDLMPHRLSFDGIGNIYINYANGAGPHGHWDPASETMDKGMVMKYNIANKTWTDITPSGFTRALGGICVDKKNPNRIIASSINTYVQQPWGWGDKIFFSENGGTSWTDLFASNKISMANGGKPWIDGHAIHWAGSIEFDPFNSEKVIVTSGNGIFMTENISASVSTWTFTTDGIEETVPLDAISIPEGPFISVIGDYDGSAYTDVFASTKLHSPQIGTTTGIDYAKKNTKYVVRAGGDDKGEKFPLYYSSNTGSTWTAFGNKPNGSLLYKGGISISADGTTVLWSPENSSTTYRTTNFGNTWTSATGVSVTNAYPVADAENANKFYIFNSSTGAFLVSTDKGVSFSQKATIAAGYKKIRVAPGKEGDIWVACGASGLQRSTNSGTSFTKIAKVSVCDAVGFGKAATISGFPAVFIWGKIDGGVVGIYKSDDAGATWVRVNDDNNEFGGPANGQFVLGDMNNIGRVYMSSAGRGVLVGEPKGTANCKFPSLGEDKVLCASLEIDLNTGITEPDYTFSWQQNGKLLANTNASLTITEPGEYSVVVNKIGCEEKSDQIVITSDLLPVSNDSVCAGNEALLSVNKTGTFNWYQTANSTTILASGTEYAPTVNSSQTYYVEDAVKASYSIGLKEFNTLAPNSWTVGTADFSATQNKMLISVSSAIKFNQLTLYVTSSSADVVFRITDGSGTIVKTVEKPGLTIGKQVINISTLLLPGNYTLDLVGTVGFIQMQTNATGAVFTIPNYVTYSHAEGWGWLGMFFDIQFSVGNTCVRTPVTAYLKTENCDATATQNLNLKAGWNLITVNVITTETSPEKLFPNATTVKTADKFYLKNNPSYLQTLTTIQGGLAYLVMNTIDETVKLTGLPITLVVYTLKTGWNMLGYPKKTTTNISIALKTIETKTVTVKSFDGFWEPNGATNSILQFEPNKAYYIKVNSDCTLSSGDM